MIHVPFKLLDLWVTVTAAAASMAPKEQTTYQGAQSQQFLLTLGLCPAFLPLSAHPLAGGSFIPSHVY